MWDMATPIMLGNKHVGNIFLGQFLFNDEVPDLNTFREQARRFGFNEQEYIEALDRVPRWSRETVHTTMTFYADLAELIGNLSYSNIKLASALEERKLAEEALRESEEKFRGIYEESPIGIELYDHEGTLLDLNRACLDTFGVTDAKVLKGFKLFENPNLREEFKEQLRRGESVRREIPYDFEKVLNLYETTKSGTIYLDVLITPLGNVKKETDIGYLVHTLDVTKRKKAEEALRESETKYRRLHESMREAFVSVDMNGHILEANRSFQTMLGYSEKELRQLSNMDITLEKWHDFEKKIIKEQVLIQGHSNVYEKECRRKNGIVFPVEVRTFLVHDYAGKRVMWAIVRDITERKRTEKTLEEQRQQLEEANKELESFSYSISHDLRAPLRAIDGFSKMILKKQGSQFDDETRSKFDVIRRNTEMMGQQIDGLLELSRLGRKSLTMSIIDMDKLIREVWEEIEVINPGRKMSLVIKSPPPAYGDRQLIRLVYSNLLSNAVKFTKKKDVALIETGGFLDDAKGNVYYVKDNGAGFDMAHYDKLFGVFQRLHSAEEFEGTGIGLATIQRIISKHGGRVWAESKVDEGATFYFLLPASSRK
ncbi:MAG: PAS domain S-box protein [Smithella sp.]